MPALLQDLRYAIRGLAANRGFTAAGLLVLALGIGANTAIFSVINAVFLRPLPFDPGARLVEIRQTQGEHQWSVSYPDFVDWRREARAFDQMAATSTWPATRTDSGEAHRLEVAFVSDNFFRTLQVAPASGRGFTPEDDRETSPPVAVVRHSYWQTMMGADPLALGRTLTLDGRAYTVVGVLPTSFRFHRLADVYVPFAQCIQSKGMNQRGNHNNVQVIARLKTGTGIGQARAEMDTIARRLAAVYPATNAGMGVSLTPVRELLTGDVRRSLFVLFGAVVVVLLIACANVASLLIARSAARWKEIAVRAALGASRGRLVRQLVTESVVLACAGGLLGLLVAGYTFGWLVKMLPWGFERGDVRIDATVLAFSFLLSLSTGAVFGLAPAWQTARAPLSAILKEGSRAGASGARSRLRQILVVAEVALATVLLAVAGLLFRSLWEVMRVHPGYNPEHVLAVQLSWPAQGPDVRLAGFYRSLIERIEALPGVRSAGAVSPLPLAGDAAIATFHVLGAPLPERGHYPEARRRVATPGYFRTMGIPLLRGRIYTEADGVMPAARNTQEFLAWFLQANFTAVISRSMAERHWPGKDPVGQRFQWGAGDKKGPLVTVVGVVGDTRNFALDRAAEPHFYLPPFQFPAAMSLTIRTEGDPLSLAAALRSAVKELNGSVPVTRVSTMREIVAGSISGRRSHLFLVGLFATLAVGLAALGIYGLLSFVVSQRTHEIGVRMALGASGPEVRAMLLSQTALLGGAGIALGTAGAIAATRVLESMLYAVRATDPATLAGSAAVLFGTVLLASYVPARRATRIDPLLALRCD